MLLGLVAFYTLSSGALLSALVLFGLTAGGLVLTYLLVRMDLRHYMSYRHRI